MNTFQKVCDDGGHVVAMSAEHWLFTFTNLYNKKVIHKYFIYNKKWLPTNLYRRTDGYCLLYKKQYIKKTLFYLQYVV